MEAIFVVIGIAIGWVACMVVCTFIVDGILNIDTTDPEKDSYLLEFSTDLDKIPKRKRLYFKVKLRDKNIDHSE